MSRDDAARIVDAILVDACDRRGIRQAIEGCDDAIRHQIREEWIAIVMTGGDGRAPWWVTHDTR